MNLTTVSISEAVAQARRELLRHSPFIASIVLQQDIVPISPEKAATIYTTGRTIYLNPDFFLSLLPGERIYVLAHCAWHCALLHQWRRERRDKELWDIACDLEVYHRIQNENSIECPESLADKIDNIPIDFHGFSAEEIYEELCKLRKMPRNTLVANPPSVDQHNASQSSAASNEKAAEKKLSVECTTGNESISTKASDSNGEEVEQGGKGTTSNEQEQGVDTGSTNQDAADGSENSTATANGDTEHEQSWPGEQQQPSRCSTDASEHDSLHDNDSDQVSLDNLQDVVNLVRNAAEQAEKCRQRQGRGQGKGIGAVPGSVIDVLNSFKPPSQDWRSILADYVIKAHSDERRWIPPARRHIWRGIYLPSIHSEKLNAVLAIDTSGSAEDQLERFFSELVGIVKSVCSQFEITVIQCDTKIQHVEVLTEYTVQGKKNWKAHGIGGTEFTPVFDYVDEQQLQPEVLIYLTDGLGTAPAEPPSYPVIWAIVDEADNKKPCDWGIEVKIPPIE